jgi:hypothetical protein
MALFCFNPTSLKTSFPFENALIIGTERIPNSDTKSLSDSISKIYN